MILPIVARELRVASRRRFTHTSRTVAAGIAVVLSGWVSLVLPQWMPSTEVGSQVFKTLSWFAFVYSLIAGAKATADAISSEKRQGTLGLLFLTDLRAYDVILGKLAVTSLDAIYGLLGIIPLLGIPLLMGGVTAGEFVRAALAILGALFFSLSVGMFASSISYVERKAVGAAFLIVAVASAAIPILAAIMDDAGDYRLLARALFGMSPTAACWITLHAGYISAPLPYWLSVFWTFALSILLLWIASRAAARFWTIRPEKQSDWRERWRYRLRGSPNAEKRYRQHSLDLNPIFWLSSRDRWTRFYPWIVLFCMTLLWCWALINDRAFVQLAPTAAGLYLFHLLFKYWFATIASYGFSTDRDHGAMEIIPATPLRVSEIIAGQWLALRRLFLWPFVALLAAELLLIGANWDFGISSLSSEDLQEPHAWMLFALSGAILLVTDCVALGWLGFWLSLRARTPHRAATTAMAGVLTGPTLAFLLLIGLINFFRRDIPAPFWITLWLALGLVTDLWFIVNIRRNFALNVRLIVSEQSSARHVRE